MSAVLKQKNPSMKKAKNLRLNGLTKVEYLKFQAGYTKFGNQNIIQAFQELDAWFQGESSKKVLQLPHLGAAIELWELVTVVYNTDTIASVIKLIEEGEESPADWDSFVIKYNLDWPYFTKTGKLIA